MFGNLRYNKGLDRFTLRGQRKVDIQWKLYCMGHNIEKLAHHGYGRYLYITEGMDTYTRRWNETNYTPLIFLNDRLSGWGWNQLDTAAKRYEFVIKDR